MILSQTDENVNDNTYYPYGDGSLEEQAGYWAEYAKTAAEAAKMTDLEDLLESQAEAQEAVELAYWGTPSSPDDPPEVTSWESEGRVYTLTVPGGEYRILGDDLTLARARGRRDALELARDTWFAGLDSAFEEEDIEDALTRWAQAVAAGQRLARPAVTLDVVMVPGMVRVAEPPPAEEQLEEEQERLDGDPGALPDHLLTVPGFIEQVVEFNLSTAKRPQPALALAGALCLQAVLIGRKLRDEFGSRSNVQFIGVASTGKGKDWARSVNSDVLTQSLLDRLDGPEEVASDSGLYQMLSDHPCLIWQIDEFGRFLQCTESAQKSYLFNVVSGLMKLYTSAGKLYRPKAYGDAKSNLTIDQPCLILHASTTPDALFQSLSAKAVHDGFLGRCLIIEGDEKPPRQMVPERPVPTPIIETAKFWGSYRTGPGNIEDQHPEPTIVRASSDAEAVFEALAETADQRQAAGGRGSAVWTRAEQKARQLALIYAASANRETPVIDIAAATWACDFTSYLTSRMVHLCSIYVSANEQENRQQKVLRIIKDAGGRIGQRELSRATQWLKARERLEILHNMMEAGLIRQATNKTATKTGVVWEASK